MKRQLETAKAEVTKPFAQEAELKEKLDRLSALNALLNMDKNGNDAQVGNETPKQPFAISTCYTHTLIKLMQE